MEHRVKRFVGVGRTCILFFVIIAAAMAAAGCGAFGTPTWDEGTDSIRHAFFKTRNFVNPSPTIDVRQFHWDNPDEKKLSLLFSPVDAKVMDLMEYVTSIDSRPTAAWIDALIVRFPWVDGIFVTDGEGKMLVRRPPASLKHFSSPLVFDSIWRQTLVKTVVDYTPLGPELYFGMPDYEGSTFVGLHVVYFDPRVLFTFCPKPNELLIIDPRAKKVWHAGDDPLPQNVQALADLPWTKTLKKKVHGAVESGGVRFTWLARYIGPDLFIYAIKSTDEGHKEKGFFSSFFGGGED